MAAYAKSIDAFLISENNFFFFADLPRGLLPTRHLPLEKLLHGPINIAGLTYYRQKFLNSFKCVEEGKVSISLSAH